MRKKRHNYTPEEKVAIQASPRRTGSSEHIFETIQFSTGQYRSLDRRVS